MKDIVEKLPADEAWEDLEKELNKNPSDDIVKKSELARKLAGLIKQNEAIEKSSAILKKLCFRGARFVDHLVSAKVLEALKASDFNRWTETTKTNFAPMLREFALVNGVDTFRAFPLIVKLILNGPPSAQEDAAAALQGLAYASSLKESIVDAPELSDLCEVIETTKDMNVCRSLMGMLNNLSVGSNVTRLDRKMYVKGVLSTIVFAMNNITDGEVLRDCYCFTRNITLAEEDVKVYLCERGSEAICKALQHEFGPVREHAGGLIRNLGTNGPRSNKRKTEMIDAGIMPVLVSMLKDDKFPTAKLQGSYALWNLSNSSLGSRTIIKNDLVPDILSIFEKTSWDEMIGGEIYKSKLVGVLCCLSANAGEQGCNDLRTYGLQNHLHPLMMSKDPKQQPINAACGLANLVGHLENHPLLKADTTIFKMICDCIEATRRGESYHGAYYSEWGLIRNLANMSVSDSNKPLLKKTNSVECACKGFRVGMKYVKLEECVAKLISNMSFQYNLETDFEVDVFSIIKDIQNKSDSEEARNYANVALFQQKQKSVKPEALLKRQESLAADDSSTKHIMVSFQAKAQPHAEKIKEFLVSKDIDCYLANAQEASLDSMATAVEEASAVIMCLSSDYKESASCRSEGEYAFNLQKTIIPICVEAGYVADGWLAAMVADSKVIDASSDDLFAKASEELFEQVKGFQKTKGDNKNAAKTSSNASNGETAQKVSDTATPTVSKVSMPTTTPVFQASQPQVNTAAELMFMPQLLSSFLGHLEQVRTNITNKVDEKLGELDKKMRDLEIRVRDLEKKN